jgi:transcription initiation factor IIE alpha subunit
MKDKEVLDTLEDFLMNNFEEDHSYTQEELHDMLEHVCNTIDKRDEDAHENKFSMQYVCPDDGTRWTMEWSCTCNDKCPTCNKEIEPSEVEDLD